MIRVLIAEDEPPIQRSIKAMIERLDDSFEVVGLAGDGEQAMRLLEGGGYDAVFTDIRMPVMSGIQLMEAIQARYPDVLLVVISGYGTFEYTSHALRAHALDYLLKPLNEDELKKLLIRLKQQYLARRRQRLQRELSAGINRAPEGGVGDGRPGDGGPGDGGSGEGGQRLLVALMQASARYWSGLNLEGLIEELLGELHSFTWVFMGDSASERVVLLEVRPGMVEMLEYVHEYLLQQGGESVRCACFREGVELAGTRTALRLLSDALSRADERAFLVLSAQSSTAQELHPLAERVRRYLEANYEQHITNQTLADQFGYVPSYISLLFRKSLGLSPSEYLSTIRLERAKQLMKDEPRMMVKEVAERVGFKNQYHFSKAFKRHTGLWPTGYRDGEAE